VEDGASSGGTTDHGDPGREGAVSRLKVAEREPGRVPEVEAKGGAGAGQKEGLVAGEVRGRGVLSIPNQAPPGHQLSLARISS
jgi:hypothetical protein